MKYFFLLLSSILFFQISSAQNLFINGDFEIYDESQPYLLRDHDSINLIGITQPNMYFPIYLRMQKHKDMMPSTGNACMGCGLMIDHKNEAYLKNYIGLFLSEKLKKDSMYLLSFHYRLPFYCNASMNTQGYFSDAPIYYPNFKNIVIPNYISFPTINCAQGIWHAYDYLYKAKGNEEIFYIGNLEPDSTIQLKFIRPQQDTTSLPYFDNFTLQPLSNEKAIRVYSIYFDTDKYQISSAELKRLNDFIKKLKQLKIKNIAVYGYTDSTGIESHNKVLQLKRKQAVSDLFLKNGLPVNLKSSTDFLLDDKMININSRRTDIYVQIK